MLSEGAELIGESGATYLAVAPLGQANVWVGSVRGSPSDIVVIKEPAPDDPYPWRSFMNELAMHELFKQTISIRKQVDRIPPTESGGPPMLVLEMFETTLWTARTKRPFTIRELKATCKAALIGLRDVHDQGLVYADLKMQNIMVNGFDVNDASNDSKLVVKLGDLGEVMPPSPGKVQPVSYRAPEVFFRGEITSKADIWGWGLIYCHLLEARNRFSKTGWYDDLPTSHGTISERETAVRYAISNDYKIHDEPYFQNATLPPRNDATDKGDQWEELRSRGLADGEVDFLRWVMRADPTKRPNAVQILSSGWLDKTESDVAAGFKVPMNAHGTGRSSIEFDPTRSDGQQGRKVVLDSLNAGNTPLNFLGGPTTEAPKTLGDHLTEAQHGRAGNSALISDGPVHSNPANGGHAQGVFTSTTSAAPISFEAQGTIDEQLDRIYDNRTTHKRRSSNSFTADTAAKKAYTPGPQSGSSVQSVNQNQRPTAEAVSAANAASAASLGGSETQGRPGISSNNTGTFLSYR